VRRALQGGFEDSAGPWAILAAAVALMMREATKALLPVIQRRMQRREVEASKRGYEALANLWDTLEGMRHATGASRVLVLISGNGGDRTRPGVDVGVTAAYVTVGVGVRNVRRQFRSWPPDQPYTKLLARIAKSDGQVLELVTDHLETGALRDLYEVDGFVGSLVSLVTHIPQKRWMVYVSACFSPDVASAEGADLIVDAIQRDAFRGGVNQLKEIFNDSWEILL
jgi:hypothetical protein